MTGAPAVSVALATRNRSAMLADLLESLRAQTLPPDSFEVVVVDDGSTDQTAAVLEEYEGRDDLRLRVIRRESSAGPAVARNQAWRAARAPLIAFTDDDCVATPRWLEEGLEAARRAPGTIVQGRTEPRPDQVHRLTPFARSQVITQESPRYETCNIFYPRELLERVGGFSEEFPIAGGEDTELAWRALEQGADACYASEVVVHHAVVAEGPLGMLRYALKWEKSVALYARIPALRQELRHGVFWSPRHEHLLRFLISLPLARRSRVVALLLAYPYLRHLFGRRSRGLLAPWLLLYDLVELYAIARGAIRHRVLVL